LSARAIPAARPPPERVNPPLKRRGLAHNLRLMEAVIGAALRHQRVVAAVCDDADAIGPAGTMPRHQERRRSKRQIP